MFQLHDKTRRLLGIVCLTMLGLLPALAAGVWCVARRLPVVVRMEADRLGRELGVRVTLQKAEHLRPGVVCYDGVELADFETGQILLRCRRLEIAERSSDAKASSKTSKRPAFSVAISQAEADAGAVDQVWRWMQRLLESQAGCWELDLQFAADRLTIRDGDRRQTLSGVAGFVETLSGGAQIRAEFHLPDAKEPAYFRVVRNRETSPPATGFEFFTGGGSLPCDVMAAAVGQANAKSLGPQCRFRGRVWAKQSPDGWQGEIAGQLLSLDVGRLVAANFPYRMTGVGDVEISAARFCDGRLLEGSGTLNVGPGSMDRLLLMAAVDRLGLTPCDRQLSPLAETAGGKNAAIVFQQLAAAVAIDANGLRIRGCCDRSGPNALPAGAILSADGRCVVAESLSRVPQSSAALASMLSGGDSRPSAAAGVDWLVRHLPPMSNAAISSMAEAAAAVPDARRR